MSLRRWYLIMLFIPLIMPAIIFAAAAILGYETVMQHVDVLVRFMIICSMIGCVPYFFFASAVSWWSRKRTVAQIRKASWWLPWIFTPVCALFFLIAFSITYPEGDAIQGALLMAVFCVPVGFIYVIFVHILTRLAQSINLIKT